MADGDLDDQVLYWKQDTESKPTTIDFVDFCHIVKVDGIDGDPPVADLVNHVNAEFQRLDKIVYPKDPLIAQRSKDIRNDYAKQLKAISEDIIADPKVNVFDITMRMGRAKGQYDSRIGQNSDLNQFAELEPPDEPTTLVINPIRFDATGEQQTLIIDVRRALTVVDLVLERKYKEKSDVREAKKIREGYLRELKDIVDEGLSTSFGAFYAARRLEAFKASFVAREADAVKNGYIWQLGSVSLQVSILLLSILVFVNALVYLGDHFDIVNEQMAARVFLFSNFILLVAASCAGTWLSFSLRKVVLEFDDLAGLEEDRLNPMGRIVFVALLTCVLALAIHQRIVTIKVGETEIAAATPLMAILLGVLCGIAERSLSGVIAKRASDVVGAAGRMAEEPTKK